MARPRFSLTPRRTRSASFTGSRFCRDSINWRLNRATSSDTFSSNARWRIFVALFSHDCHVVVTQLVPNLARNSEANLSAVGSERGTPLEVYQRYFTIERDMSHIEAG